MKRLAILISNKGTGINLQAIIDATEKRKINAKIALVVSDTEDALDGAVLNPDKTKALWNKGKMTEKAIQNFFDNKTTYAGSSLHFLSKDFDFGKVLGRCFEKIRKGDTIESLYKRLKKKENRLYVKILQRLCNG